MPRGRGRGCDGWHTVWPDSQTIAEIALITDSDLAELIRLNRDAFPGLRTQTVLPPGSKLRLPREKTALAQLKGAVAYRHWTFANDTVDKTEESYMMARRLVKDDGASVSEDDTEVAGVAQAKKVGTMWLCRNGTAEEMATGNDDAGGDFGGGGDPGSSMAAESDKHLTTPTATRPNLVDTIVELLPKPSAWSGGKQPEREFYYVLTHVEDLDWCHGVRVVSRSNFTKGNHIGKPRWTLSKPEEHMKELDAPAARCLPLKKVAETTRKSKSSGSLLDRVW